MPLDFRKLMTPEQRVKFDAQQEWFHRDVAEAQAMDDDTLANKLEYYLSQSETVHKWVPGTPVYDSALHHVLLPEAARRLREKAKTP
jgi:hypothetical protein